MSEMDQLLKTVHDPVEFMCQVGDNELDNQSMGNCAMTIVSMTVYLLCASVLVRRHVG